MVIGFHAPLSFLNASGFRSDAEALVQSRGPKPRWS